MSDLGPFPKNTVLYIFTEVVTDPTTATVTESDVLTNLMSCAVTAYSGVSVSVNWYKVST